MKRCDGCPVQGTAWASEFSPWPNPLHKRRNLSHLSHQRFARVVTALSFEGAVAGLATLSLQSCPASNCFQPVMCPLHARAIVILFSAAHGWRGKLTLPSSSCFSSQSGACEHSLQCPAPET